MSATQLIRQKEQTVKAREEQSDENNDNIVDSFVKKVGRTKKAFRQAVDLY